MADGGEDGDDEEPSRLLNSWSFCWRASVPESLVAMGSFASAQWHASFAKVGAPGDDMLFLAGGFG